MRDYWNRRLTWITWLRGLGWLGVVVAAGGLMWLALYLFT